MNTAQVTTKTNTGSNALVVPDTPAPLIVCFGEKILASATASLLSAHYRLVDGTASGNDQNAQQAMATLLETEASGIVVLSYAAAARAALNFVKAAPEKISRVLLISPELDGQFNLSAVGTATLVLVGCDDTGPAAAVACRCRAEMPECHMMFVYAANQDVAADRPEAVYDSIREFIATGELFPVNSSTHLIHP